jgi:hypothetical protein
MSDGSSSEEGLNSAHGKGKKRHHKHPHWKKDKDGDKHGGVPRKAMKKLIRKELDKQCHQIFESLFNGQESDQKQME